MFRCEKDTNSKLVTANWCSWFPKLEFDKILSFWNQQIEWAPAPSPFLIYDIQNFPAKLKIKFFWRKVKKDQFGFQNDKYDNGMCPITVAY